MIISINQYGLQKFVNFLLQKCIFTFNISSGNHKLSNPGGCWQDTPSPSGFEKGKEKDTVRAVEERRNCCTNEGSKVVQEKDESNKAPSRTFNDRYRSRRGSTENGSTVRTAEKTVRKTSRRKNTTQGPFHRSLRGSERWVSAFDGSAADLTKDPSSKSVVSSRNSHVWRAGAPKLMRSRLEALRDPIMPKLLAASYSRNDDIICIIFLASEWTNLYSIQ